MCTARDYPLIIHWKQLWRRGTLSCPAGDAADIRVVMTSEQHCAEFEELADVIKVCTL